MIRRFPLRIRLSRYAAWSDSGRCFSGAAAATKSTKTKKQTRPAAAPLSQEQTQQAFLKSGANSTVATAVTEPLQVNEADSFPGPAYSVVEQTLNNMIGTPTDASERRYLSKTVNLTPDAPPCAAPLLIECATAAFSSDFTAQITESALDLEEQFGADLSVEELRDLKRKHGSAAARRAQLREMTTELAKGKFSVAPTNDNVEKIRTFVESLFIKMASSSSVGVPLIPSVFHSLMTHDKTTDLFRKELSHRYMEAFSKSAKSLKLNEKWKRHILDCHKYARARGYESYAQMVYAPLVFGPSAEGYGECEKFLRKHTNAAVLRWDASGRLLRRKDFRTKARRQERNAGPAKAAWRYCRQRKTFSGYGL